MIEQERKNLESQRELIASGDRRYDCGKIEKALNFCINAHQGQKRYSGEEFFYHPVSVAYIVYTLGMDTESICAALLHDAVEDTDATLDDIRREFGVDIALLVDGVTKLGKIPISAREQQGENLRKMLIAMAEDIRVMVVKLSDRLHNMRTISSMRQDKQLSKAVETMEVYAPIAPRLGIRGIKEELEDLALLTLDPVAYKDIEELLKEKSKENHNFLGDITQKVGDRVREYIPNAHMESRTKSIHGIYRKMYAQNKNFEEIYDVYAVRIIVDTVNDCYNALGVIHDMYRPIPGRFKDYISTPKPNKYQSLHTTVIGREGIPFEVQIRTWDMHHTAEFGIAAHWKYKEGISGKDNMDDHLVWVRQILDAQKDSGDVEDILQSIKIDLSQEDVFAVTPKGDVINLPVGSTVIDFAFAIHTQVGCRMVGAKADGKIVPLTHEVKTGQIIEILTTNQAGHGPSRDWMNIVKTSQARNKIRAWFKRERRTENIADGKEQLEKEFLRSGLRFPAEMLPEYMEKLADRHHFANVDEFFAAIGYGGLIVSRIMPRVKEDYQKLVNQKQVDISQYVEEEKKTRNSPDGVRIEGIDNCLIKLSRCCSPLPGDEIIGFITRGHGVSVHKRQCSNVPKNIEASPDSARWVKAYWTGGAKQTGFKTYIKVTAVDRQGVLADVSALLLGMHVAMHAVSAKELRSGSCTINLTISVENIEHLKNICQKLDKIPGVYRVERTNG